MMIEDKLIRDANFYLEIGESAIFIREKTFNFNLKVSKTLNGLHISKNSEGKILYRRKKVSIEKKTYKNIIWVIGENGRKVQLPLKVS